MCASLPILLEYHVRLQLDNVDAILCLVARRGGIVGGVVANDV